MSVYCSENLLDCIMACTFLNLIQLMLQWRKTSVEKDLKEFDPDELLESGFSQSWAQAMPDSGPDDFGTEIELQELPKSRASSKAGPSSAEPKRAEDQSDSSSPESEQDGWDEIHTWRNY